MAQTKHRSGDRKDGRLIRTLPGFNQFIPYVMPSRNDAQIFYGESFDIRALDKRLRELRVAGYKGIGILHFMIAAYIRGVSMLPGINRFVSGRRIYARNNIEVVLAVKRALSIDATEATIKVKFEPTDTIFDVYRKVNEKIEEVRMDSEETGTEDFADTVCKLPRFLIRFALWVLGVIDYFGKLPQALLDLSPFHGSMILNDMGSIRLDAVYHHIYNFGNLPVFISFGAKHHQYEVDKKGNVIDKKVIDCKFVIDERIADGHYYSKFLQAYRYMFAHPEIVENPPTRIIEDIR